VSIVCRRSSRVIYELHDSKLNNITNAGARGQIGGQRLRQLLFLFRVLDAGDGITLRLFSPIVVIVLIAPIVGFLYQHLFQINNSYGQDFVTVSVCIFSAACPIADVPDLVDQGCCNDISLIDSLLCRSIWEWRNR
jgi:hypothetical protein